MLRGRSRHHGRHHRPPQRDGRADLRRRRRTGRRRQLQLRRTGRDLRRERGRRGRLRQGEGSRCQAGPPAGRQRRLPLPAHGARPRRVGPGYRADGVQGPEVPGLPERDRQGRD